MTGLVDTIQGAMPEAVVRASFTADVRKQLYRALATFLRNRVPMVDALEELHGIYTDDGAHPNTPAGVFLYEAKAVVSQGRPFSDALKRWVGPEEASLVATGEKSGNIELAFQSAINLVKANSAIFWAVVGSAIHPFVLSLMLVAQLGIVAYMLVPELTSIVDRDTLGGAAAVLVSIADLVVALGPYLLAIAIPVVAWSLWSLPRVTGAFRLKLERIPPWSTYRAVVGSTFLSNVAVMLRNGIGLEEALVQLRGTAAPYLAERIDGALHGVRQGLNFGEALHLSEMKFPAPFAIRMIRPLASKEGFDLALQDYAQEWAEDTVATVKASMSIVQNLILLAIAGIVILVPLATLDIKTAIEASM